MARVFISYRRADGQYAVGWIEERLRRLDEVTHLRTAFRDNSLRLGDDLGDRLADEVRDCDVLIAVVGPHWRGVRDDGSARIDDSIDWVGREIVSALAGGKRIIPVLIGGAEPLQAADLPEALRPFADLLAVRFEGLDDLELLERDLREYLDELDHERARLSGLDEPIVPPSARQPAWVWALALVAGGAAGATAAWRFDNAVANREWHGLSTVSFAVWTFLFVIGLSYFHRVLADAIEVRWRTVAKTGALAGALVALTVVAFAPGQNGEVAFTVLQAALAVGLMSPWIVMMLGASWSTSKAAAIRDRAEVIALHRRGLTLATPVISSVLGLSVATTAAAAEVEGFDTAAEWSLMAFGVFLTLILVAALQFSLSGLRHDSEFVRLEIADLAPVTRRNVERVLVGDVLNARMWLVWVTTIPVATSLVVVAALKWWL
jgi:hypothetical protein